MCVHGESKWLHDDKLGSIVSPVYIYILLFCYFYGLIIDDVLLYQYGITVMAVGLIIRAKPNNYNSTPLQKESRSV